MRTFWYLTGRWSGSNTGRWRLSKGRWQKQDFSDCIVSKQAELSSKKSMSVTDSGQGRGRTELKHCEVPSDPAVSQHTGQKTTKMKLETLKTNQWDVRRSRSWLNLHVRDKQQRKRGWNKDRTTGATLSDVWWTDLHFQFIFWSRTRI